MTKQEKHLLASGYCINNGAKQKKDWYSSPPPIVHLAGKMTNLPQTCPLMFWGRCQVVDFEGIWGRC